MADNVTTLGGGWGDTDPGTAEFALGGLLAAGALTGEALITELKAQGFGNRGPAYYPAVNGKGPFYALGNPHDYAAINADVTPPAWDLIGFDKSQEVIQPGQPPAPAPAPPSSSANICAEVQDALTAALQASSLATKADVANARDAIVDRISIAQEAIQQQIDQVVKNAETSVRALEPIIAAAIPALGALFPPAQS